MTTIVNNIDAHLYFSVIVDSSRQVFRLLPTNYKKNPYVHWLIIFFYAVENNNRFQNGKSSQYSKVSTIFHQLLLYLLINVYLLDGVQRRLNIS